MKPFTKVLLGSALAVAMPWQAATAAAVGSTAISVTFPDIVILHYVSSIDITFDGTVLSDLTEDEGAATAYSAGYSNAFSVAGGLSQGAGIPGVINTWDADASLVTVTVANAYAVRGITTSGNIDIVGTGTAAVTNAAATSSVALSNFAVDADQNGAFVIGGAGEQIAAPGMSKATASVGDFRFVMDISAITVPGVHATGGTYTVTATATP